MFKSGQHIQNYPHQVELFNFVEKYEDELRAYYRNLFKVNLAGKGSDYTRYFFLDLDEESHGIVKSRAKKLTPEHTLLGILLLKIHRIDKYFINDIYVPDFIQLLKTNEEYKNFIYNLFARRREKEATEIDENTIDEWVRNSLKEFERMGWIHFDPRNKELFEIMPSIDRLFTMYSYEIHNIDRLIDETNSIEERTGGLYPVEEGDNE
jgi:chromosome condensin MukBEF MukE localization factor